jgi:hypothetical protein
LDTSASNFFNLVSTLDSVEYSPEMKKEKNNPQDNSRYALKDIIILLVGKEQYCTYLSRDLG